MARVADEDFEEATVEPGAGRGGIASLSLVDERLSKRFPLLVAIGCFFRHGALPVDLRVDWSIRIRSTRGTAQLVRRTTIGVCANTMSVFHIVEVFS